MSYRFTGATPTRVTLSPTPVTINNRPWTLSGWTKMDNYNPGPFVGLSDSTAQYDYIEIGPLYQSPEVNHTGTVVAKIFRGSATATASVSFSSVPARFTWFPFVLTLTADNRLGASIAGQTLLYTNLPAGISNFNTFYAGTRLGAGQIWVMNGLISALAIHNGSWDQTLVNLHATGRNPGTIGSCMYYWPMAGNLVPEVGDSQLVATVAFADPEQPNITAPPVLRPMIISLF